MARYHINPDTGRPNICTATGARGCKYAVDGQEPPHYASKDEARAGYEQDMASSTVPQGKKRSSKKKSKAVPMSPEAAERLDSLLRMQEEKYAPLTDLELNNEAYPLVMEAIEPMEQAATTYDRWQKSEAASILRYGGRQLAGADTDLRVNTLQSIHSALATDAYLDSRWDEGDAHYAIAEVASFLDSSGKLQEESEEFQNRQRRIKKALAPTEDLDRPLPRYDGYEQEYMMAPQRRDREIRESLGGMKPMVTFALQGSGASYTASEILRGTRNVDDSPIPREHVDAAMAELNEEIKGEADSLVRTLSPDGRLPRDNYEDEPGTPLAGNSDFVMLGSGGEHLVYLSNRTGMVYKVPHRFSLTEAHRGSARYAQQAFEEAYADVDDEKLREHGVENVKTLFITAKVPTEEGEKDISVIAQPLLDPREWRSCHLNIEAQNRLQRHGVTDLHYGNVMANLRTGKIMLLDCLNVELS